MKQTPLPGLGVDHPQPPHGVQAPGAPPIDADAAKSAAPPEHHIQPPLLAPGAEPPLRSPLRITGFVALLIGTLLAVFAAWGLWGTGVLTARTQAHLETAFQNRLATTDLTTLGENIDDPGLVSGIDTEVAWDDPVVKVANDMKAQLEALPTLDGVVSEAAPEVGTPVGRIIIEKADVDWIVAEGVAPEVLRGGPGHVIGTAMPGQVGNAVISGHRTTNGAPFYHLDALSFGDLISVETLIGTHVYSVVDVRVVDPSETWVATQWDDGAWLTLTTCNPRYSSKQRMIVFATLVDGPNSEIIHARFGTPVTPSHG